MIPYGHQNISEADIEAVVEVLRSDYITQGPAVPRFEEAVARYCNSAHGVAVNSATSALHIACMALDVGPGDRVWTSAVTFVASANCARQCGAAVDLIDIDPRTYNMSTAALKERLAAAESNDALPKVVIPVHLAGQSCDMAAIKELSEKYGFRVIEDASHAIGGRYLGEPVGSGGFSDIVVFSFHPVKIITTAEGGVALTNDPRLASRMARLRTHGITRETEDLTKDPDGPWYYEQIELGFNFRMTDIQAALGSSQLARIDEFVAARHALAERYDERLAGLPVKTPIQHPDCYSGLHLYVVRLNLERTDSSHLEVFNSLREAGIGVNLHYIPIYRQPYYARMGFRHEEYPESERYYAEAISLPMFPGLTEDQQDFVVSALGEAL